MLEDWLWQCADRSYEVLQTSVWSEVLHDRDASLRTIVECIVDSNVLLVSAEVLPFINPLFENVPEFNVCQWNFFDAVDFERRTMKHFLDRAGRRFENSKSNHLLEF